MCKKKIVLFALLQNISLVAVVVGSYTTPSRQGAVTFPSTDVDNEMRGFAAFENQVTLQNSSTSCIFNSVYPVGSLVMNGGTLVLQKNCAIQGTAAFTNAGTITGNNYQVSLVNTANALTIPSSVATTTSLTSLATQSAGAVVNSVDWSYDNAYVAVGTAASSGNNLRVYSFNGTQLTLVASAAIPFAINAVRWHPSSYYLLVELAEDVNSFDVYIYQFTPETNALQSLSGGFLTGTGFIGAWHPSGSFFVSSSTNSAKQLMLFNHTNGVIGNTSGDFTYQLLPDRTVQKNSLAWDPTGRYLAVGVAASSGNNDLLIFSYDNAALTLLFGTTIGQTIQSLDWSPLSSHLAVGITGGTERLRVYAINPCAQTISEVTSARIGETRDVISVHWSPNNQYLLMGRRTNSTGTELRVYRFNSTAGTLTLSQELESSGDINSARWSWCGCYIARGDALNNVTAYRWTATETPSVFTINNTVLDFATDLVISTSLRAQGTCWLNGTGNSTVSFSQAGCLLVSSGATLIVQNLSLLGMTPGKLVCADSTAQVVLNNVLWQQDSTTSFTQGKLTIMGNVYMMGSSQFSYQSNQMSTVDAYATWHFLPGMTFAYAPSTASKTLISLTNATSAMRFVDAGLYATNVGLSLTKGTLILEGTTSITSDATSSAQGIEFGDGSVVGNNLNLLVKAGAGPRVVSGYVINKNV